MKTIVFMSVLAIQLSTAACSPAEDAAKQASAQAAPTAASQATPAASAPSAAAPVAGAAPANILGTWELTKQDNDSYAGQGILVTFTPDGKHSWGPMMPDCVYTYEAPDTLKTDCTKSMPDFKVDYKVRSVDATTLVMVNPQVEQVNTLTRK